MADRQRLQGVFSPVLTPFNPDLTPHPQRLVHHCRWLLDQGVGLAVFGTNSEANSLSVGEKRKLLDALVEAGLPPSRMMPGTGACALPDAIELTRHAVRLGCGGTLTLPPFYYKGVSDEGLYRAFAKIIDAVADERLRMYLYHFPQMSQVPVTAELVDRLLTAYPGTIAGMKDSSGNWENTRTMIERFAPRRFDVFAGSENFLLATLRAGGVGCITATGNVNPAAIAHLYQTWRDPDAEEQQRGLDATRAVFARYPMISAMKAALAWKTGRDEWATVRPPLVELAPEQRRELEAGLRAIGFELPNASALV